MIAVSRRSALSTSALALFALAGTLATGTLVTGTLALAAPSVRAADLAGAGMDWPVVEGDAANSRYSPLAKIDTSNVAKLGGAWVKKLDGETSRAIPVVRDGVMYITSAQHVFALNAKTGEELWSYKPDAPFFNLFKGVAMGDGLLFIGLNDARVQALDPKTGKLVWEAMAGEKLPVREDLLAKNPGAPKTGQWISASPSYAKGVLVVALSGGDFGNNSAVVGLDGKTGKELWRFHVIAQPGDPGHETWPPQKEAWSNAGGAVWDVPAIDPDLNLVYFGTGNPVPQYAGEGRVGDNLYTDSVVALDLKTGKKRWHYQLTHHDIWEQDVGTPLILYDTEQNGKPRKALGVMRTDGYLFLLDRATGKPVHPVEEKHVPQSAQNKTAPTQPFPVGADSIGPRCAEKDLGIPEGFKLACYYDPVDTDQPNVVMPIYTARAAPMAYSPKDNRFYVTGAVQAFWHRRFDNPHFTPVLGDVPGLKPYGTITALDAATDKIVWQKKLPRPVANGSGVLATAGGLLFHGEPDGNLQAYDAKTGDVLWQFQTGFSADGSAATYEVDGEQYVAAAANGAIWSFKLGGTVPPAPAPAVADTVVGFKGRIQATDKIAIGGMIRDMGMNGAEPELDEYRFEPIRTKVKAGTKVTWTNTGKLPHDATAADGSWGTGEIAPGQSATVTFDKPGTYTYHCKDHPWSYAQITVE